MILMHVLNLVAVYEQHGVLNDSYTGIVFYYLLFTGHNYYASKGEEGGER